MKLSRFDNGETKCYLHVVAQYPPVFGGAERYCASISESLVALDYHVQVYTSQLRSRTTWQNELVRLDVINRVPVRRFSALQRGRITWRLFHWSKHNYSCRRQLIYELGLMLAEGPVCPMLTTAILKDMRRVALVHVFGLYSAMAWQVIELAKLLRRPLIITPFTHQETGNLQMIWKQRALGAAEHIVAMTNQEKIYLAQQFNIPDQRISVVSPGINPVDYKQLDQKECRRQLEIPDSAFVLLFLGRKDEEKGLSTLFAAREELHRRGHTSAYLLLVGPDTHYSQEFLRHFSSNDRIKDLGAVDEKTKLIALNACNCLVLPSRSESFGIVLLEAWAVGKPVVVARSAATAELVVDGKDGYLFQADSALELADQLEALMLDPTQATFMGDFGKKKVLADFTTQSMGARMSKIYDSIVGKQ